MINYKEKCSKLIKLMNELTKKNCVIAFSGGVDSSLLLKIAIICSKKNDKNIYAITVSTEFNPMYDIEFSKKIAQEIGAEHIVLSINQLDLNSIRNNPVERCYLCKKYLFSNIKLKSKELRASIIIDGTNADDLKVYRPGIKVLEELGISSPLKECGFTKYEVRKLACEYGISVAKRPSMSCLATRFPYNTELTTDDLKKVELGENYLRTLGLYNIRLRIHKNIARIEVDLESISIILENRENLIKYLKSLGYNYIALDLEGFRSGSMDINIRKD